MCRIQAALPRQNILFPGLGQPISADRYGKRIERIGAVGKHGIAFLARFGSHGLKCLPVIDFCLNTRRIIASQHVYCSLPVIHKNTRRYAIAHSALYSVITGAHNLGVSILCAQIAGRQTCISYEGHRGLIFRIHIFLYISRVNYIEVCHAIGV